MNKKMLLFDFDGVIVDTFELSYSISKLREPELTKDVYRSYFNGNIYEVAPDQDKEEDQLDENHIWFEKYKEALATLQPVKGMVEVIQEIGNDYHLAVVSSSLNGPIKKYLKQHDLDGVFDDVLGADIHKSKLKKIHMITDKYRIAPQDAVFITDTLGDMREAAKAFIESIGVSWGVHDKTRLALGNPVKIIKNPSELPVAVQFAFAKAGQISG